jgi:hypothetical protein
MEYIYILYNGVYIYSMRQWICYVVISSIYNLYNGFFELFTNEIYVNNTKKPTILQWTPWIPHSKTQYIYYIDSDDDLD